MIKKSLLNAQGLPLIIEPSNGPFPLDSFYKMLGKDREELLNDLHRYGGLLFRGFPLKNAHDFATSIEQLNLGKAMHYIGGDSPRTKIEGAVYTSTEAPPWLKIPLHNELSFVNNHPKHIYFFCETAPLKEGETILGDAREIYKAIDPKIREKFTQKGLKYTSAYYEKSRLMDLINKWQRSHKSWPEVFETSSKAEVERKCKESGFQFEWTKNGWITIRQERPSIILHPMTQDPVWFNQAHLYDFNPKLLGLPSYIGAKLLYVQKHMRLHEISFGDESPIPRKDLYHILDTLDANTIKFPWRQGDFLVLDNVLAMHGRAPFKGKRRILAAMTG